MEAKAHAAKRGGGEKKKKTAGTDKDPTTKKKNSTSLPRTSVEVDEVETWSGSKGNKYYLLVQEIYSLFATQLTKDHRSGECFS